ncbi:tetratricopeptide repeat protein [Hanstruepera ponticola]|uniref:tetratricopeptide repeat protein n=1 Tax=Hanstruepera ponticola TaxID=2042995 RepID=UPI001780CF2E|nr:tetratricopeptide repeat protein [Hanstruepera ponticola]
MKIKPFILLFFFSLCMPFVFSQENDTHAIIVEGVDAMMEGNYSESLELLTRARVIAEEEEDYKNLFVAINNIGLNYHKLLDNNEALEYYLESYKIAIKELDYSYEMTSLNNIAILYSQENDLDKAIEYFQKAYDLAEIPQDQLKKGIYAINLAQAYNDKSQANIAMPYIEEAIKLLEADEDYLLEAEALQAVLLHALGKEQESENLITSLLPKLKGNRYAETRVVLFLTLAKIEHAKNNLNQALVLGNTALNQEPINLETRYKIYSLLHSYNEKANNYSQALIAMDSMLHIKQEIHDLRSGRQYQANKVKFEVLNYEAQLHDGRERIKSQKRLILILTISSFLIIFLLLWSLRLSRIKNKQRKDLLARQEKILNLELENEKANNLILENQLKENETKLLLEQEQHKREIESKNRKLSAKALYLIDRNRLVETIIQELEQSDKIKPSREVTEHIRRLKGLLKSDEEWENFVQYFDEVNHGLLNRLKEKHENLNANDIRFISYLYMNLSMKEIATIMNITPEACRKRKERISKKIELTENEDLYTYISQI